jgi:hypothetical protein
MAANTSMVTSSVISTTSQHKRDYSERIRRLYPGLTRMLALVKGSNLDSFGKVAYDGKGMVDKKAAKRMDPEWATYAPIEVSYQVTTGGTNTLSIADTTVFQVGDLICNSATGDVAIILELNSSTQLTVLAITGTSFSTTTNDFISALASSFEEGTSRYHSITNELTTNKTFLQIFREGVSIADTVKRTPQYTDEGMLERYMTDKMVQALRKMEGSFWFSKKATNGTTSSTLVGTGDAGTYSLYSMQGVLDYAAAAGSSFSMQGGLNWETFNTVLYPIMPKTMRADETVYMTVGRKLAGTMNQWANNKYMIMNDRGTKFGSAAKTYIMGGALEVEVLVHDLFDTGAWQNTAVFWQSSDLVYRFMEGYDIKVRENAQLPSTMGQTNIIEGIIGLQSISSGAAIKVVTQCLPE